MKKISSIFVTLAVAAMALVSCNRNEIVPSAQGLHFTVNANAPETRTYLDNQLDGNYKVGWNADDEIAIFIGTIDGDLKAPTAVFKNTAGMAERATFEGTAVAAGEGSFVSVYPASKFVKGYKDGTVGVDLLASQQPSSESFDPNADILAAPACDYESDGENVVIDDLYFKRLISVVKVNLKGSFAAGEVVKNFTMTSAGHLSEDGTKTIPDTLTGRAAIDLSSLKIVKWNTDSNYVKATPTEEVTINDDVLNAIYLAVNPTTIVAGTEVTFEAETGNYQIKKTVTLKDDLAFPKGNIAVINLTINEADCTEIVETDYSGDYVMTGTYGEKTYAAKAWVSGNNNLRTAVVTISTDGSVDASDTDHKMTFTKVIEGTYKGMYTIQDANGLYLYAASSGGNQLKGEAEPDVNAYWTVKANEDGTYAISAEKSSNRNVLEFNPNVQNGTPSPIVSCYASASKDRQSVSLYPYEGVEIPSIFTVEAAGELNVAATATSVKFNVEANVAWTASLEEPYTGVTISPESGSSSATVTLSFPANTEATAKEYIVYFNADGFSEFEFTVIQEAAKAEISISDFIALSDNQGGTFSGVVAASGKSGVIVTDGVENIYVFNPTTSPANGQNVTVTGTKTTYYDFVEVSKGASVVVNSSDNQIVRTEAVDVTSTFDTYPSSTHPSDYIKVTGRLEISGNYNNLYVDGATARTGSLQTDTDLSISDFNGKTVDIEGYYLGTSGANGKFFVILVTSISETVGAKTAQTLAFNPTSVSLTLGEEFTAPTLTGAQTTVTYASDNSDVAEVNASTGAVTIKAVGNATITATAAEDETYAKGTASYTILVKSPATESDVTDVLTADDLLATSTTYTDFSNVEKESGAVYAGQSAKDSAGYIQMRSKNSNSGIVSTTSGGTVKSVTITVGKGENQIDVYGSNTPYTSAADLYATGNTNQGTKIGSLTASGTVEFTEDYKYVGIRSYSGAIYLSKVEITWTTE